MTEFTHLHLHTEGSLLDGMCRTEALMKRAQALNMKSVAITDHGVMYKCIEFYKAAKDSEIKPIIGCEVYVTPGSRFERNGRGNGNYYHLILLAKNFEGYQNLMRLVSRGHLEGFYYKPRIDRETLLEFHEGLVCMSACLGGEVPQLIVQDKLREARQAAAEHIDIFGKENYFFELQDHGIDDQYKVNQALIEMSREMEVPLVATNDVHYVCAEDHSAHDLLLCIQTGACLTDEKRFRFDSDQFFLTGPAEMEAKFGHIPEALSNTLRVAEMCNVTLDSDQVSLPTFPVPEGYTCDTYLLQLCKEALSKRFDVVTPEHLNRLDYELSVINPKGFSPYFLIVSDFVQHAAEQGISVRARGSAAGSIVAYLLGITSIDPLQYQLMFERFLNPDRTEMPDIDLDFADNRREEMIDYAIERYGKDHVAQIGTLGTLGARAAIRDAGRALNVPLPEVDRIAKLIQGLSPSISECLSTIPDLQKLYQDSNDVRCLIDRAQSVEGVVRSSGIHAAGVVISAEPLTDCVPLQRAAETKIMRDGMEVTEIRPCTQYDMSSVSKIGLLKVDFLGLRNLTVVDNCIDMIRQRGKPDFDVDSIPEDDENTFRMLCDGHSIGVFQLESSGMRQMIRSLKPRVFEDLVPVVALYRPGPLASGMVDQFIECRHGRRQVEYLDSLLEPILKDTYGVMLYQEQIMQISMELGAFTPGDAEKLRKAMSKKIGELMDKYRSKFVRGATGKGIKEEIASTIYDQMAAFAAYGFNKAHSAAYGALAYQTAYLKANYGVEYMAALLTSLMEKKDRLAATMEECRRMGLEVLPPHINKSMVDFSPEPDSDNGIRFGLAAIKGLSPNAIEGILRVRDEGGPFTSLFDLCERTHSVDAINKGNLEALIKSGALAEISPNRRQLVEILDVALSRRQQARRNALSGQVTLFGLLGNAADSVSPRVDYPTLPKVPDYPTTELLEMERELLGLYVSNHPLHAYREFFRKNHTVLTSEISGMHERDSVTIGAMIIDFKHHQTKRGDPMMFMTVEDLNGRIDVVLFQEVLKASANLIERDRTVLIKGKVSVRSGSGRKTRGKPGAEPAVEEGDENVYSIVADEISEAVANLSDLDAWSEASQDPETSDDGSILSPEENPWGDPVLDLEEDLDSNPSLPSRSTYQSAPISLFDMTEPLLIPKIGQEIEAGRATNKPANILTDRSTGNLGEPPLKIDPSLEDKIDLNAESTIRDVYGVLPKKGEPTPQLYPPARPVQAERSSAQAQAPAQPSPSTVGSHPHKPVVASPSEETQGKILHIALPPGASNIGTLRSVAALLRQHAGGMNPVEIHLCTPDGNRIIRSPRSANVQSNPGLVRELQDQCGRKNVKVL